MSPAGGVGEQWRFGSLLDYFDERESRLEHLAGDLRSLGESDQAVALDVVSVEVARLAEELTNDTLQKTAVSVIEDLYKVGGTLTKWDDATRGYTEAMWGTFFDVLAARGYLMHYVIDNTFPDGLQRPLMLFPELFNYAGLVYACPHVMASKLPETAGVEPTIAALEWTLEEGRDIARRLASRATAKGRHLAYLEIDYVPGCLDHVIELGSGPGIIQVFRQEAPGPGSTIQVSFPEATNDRTT